LLSVRGNHDANVAPEYSGFADTSECRDDEVDLELASQVKSVTMKIGAAKNDDGENGISRGAAVHAGKPSAGHH
jgi:hypothetical protein